MDKAQEKIAKSMFQLVFLVDDKEIEQRWKHLQPSIRSQWSDKAESLIEVFEGCGYRKLPEGEPPLLSDGGFLEWCGSHKVEGCSKTRKMVDEGEEIREVMKCEDCRAEAQRNSDIKWIRGL